MEEDKDAKLICQNIVLTVPRRFDKIYDRTAYQETEGELLKFDEFDGNDSVVIYCEKEKAMKRLPKSRNVKVSQNLISRLKKVYSDNNIVIVEKSLDSLR